MKKVFKISILIGLIFCSFLLFSCSSEKKMTADLVNGMSEKYPDYVDKQNDMNMFYKMDSGNVSATLNLKGEFDPEVFQEICIATKEWVIDYGKSKDLDVSLCKIDWEIEKDGEKYLWSYNCSFSDLVAGRLYLLSNENGQTGTQAFNSVPISEISNYASEDAVENAITLPSGIAPKFDAIDYKEDFLFIYVIIPDGAGWDTIPLDVKKDIVRSSIRSNIYMADKFPDAKEIVITGSEGDEIIFDCTVGGDTNLFTNNGVIIGTYKID